MPRVLFVDHKNSLDWSNFSVAGNVRARLGKATTPVEMIGRSDLSTLGPAETLFLSAHGSSESSGKFNDAKVLAEKLQAQGLKKTHQSLVLLTCSSAVQPDDPLLKPFAENLKTELVKLKYNSIVVEGGRGFVVVFPEGRQAVVPRMGGPAGDAQAEVEKAHANVLMSCTLRVDQALSNPTSAGLGQAADEIAAMLIKFYADLANAFKPFLMGTQYAYKKF
jgi:hypothetical protein